MDLNEVRKQMELFDEVIGTTNETGDEQMDQTNQQEVLHPNPTVNKMLLANREKRARLKALGLKETHKKPKKKLGRLPREISLHTPPFLQHTKEEFTINISSVQARVINESLETLRNLGCTYEVGLNGQVWRHGVVPVVVAGGATLAKDGAKYGARSSYIHPFIADLKVGKVVEIPFGGFKPKDIQSTMASLVIKKYGANNVTSHIDSKREVIEVLRKR